MTAAVLTSMPKGLPVSDQKEWLLSTIRTAVAAANDAGQNVTTAQAEHVSRSRQVGVWLLEAKKLHPKVKDFEAFLAKVDGLKLSRAYDLLRMVGGRVTDEELRKDARERKQKSRAKANLPKPDSVTEPMSRNPSEPAQPTPQPEPSVTSPPVTESAEPTLEERAASTLRDEADRLDAEEAAEQAAMKVADTVDYLKTQIETLSYERAHDLSLWLTDYLIAIRPEHGAATQKKAA